MSSSSSSSSSSKKGKKDKKREKKEKREKAKKKKQKKGERASHPSDSDSSSSDSSSSDDDNDSDDDADDSDDDDKVSSSNGSSSKRERAMKDMLTQLMNGKQDTTQNVTFAKKELSLTSRFFRTVSKLANRKNSNAKDVGAFADACNQAVIDIDEPTITQPTHNSNHS